MKKYWWWGIIIVFLLAVFSLRVFRLTDSPPSPYWEEVALGYDAYSLALTGKDHHGMSLPVVAFESFGDWKPSGYFYALVPFIKTFGLNVFAIRLPSVIAGIGIVAGMGVLTWQLTERLKPAQRQWLMLLSMFIAAISPWLIQFSRAAWEVNLAALFILWGVVFGQQAISTKQKQKLRFLWLCLSVLLLFAAMYTYHVARILAPGLGLVMAWQFFQQDIRARRKNIWLVGYILPLFLTAALLRPFANAIGTPVLGQRVAETSIFSDISVIQESNRLKELNGNSLLARAMYHRYVLFGGKIAEQFFSHFNLSFLFVTGDANPRHSTQYFGLFYPFDVVFMLAGAWWAIKYLPKQPKQLLGAWLIFGILPSSLAVGVPHALRILPVAPVFLLTIVLGVWQVIAWLQVATLKVLPSLKRLLILWPIAAVMLYLLVFAAFYRHLLFVYPQRFAVEWQYGYSQMVAAIEQLREENPDLPIYITREYGRPAMYYWFYTKTDPTLVQQLNSTVKKDQGEYLEFDNLHFVRSLDEVTTTPAIVAGSPGQLAQFKKAEKLTNVPDLAGQVIWSIAVVQ
jgi:hypothetical protein